MSQPPLLRTLVVVALVVLGGSALDAVLNLNDRFRGEICDPNDVDVVEFDALVDETIRLRVVATVPETLRPRLILTRKSDGALVADVASGGPVTTIGPIVAPQSQGYRLQILSADGSVGTYVLITQGRIDPERLKFVDTQNVLGGESVEVTFDALNGFGFSGQFAAATPGPRFANPSLEGPNGPVDLSGFVTSLGDLLRIDTVPLGLTALGTFTLKADNVGGTGDVKTRVQLRPTIKPTVVVEDDDCN